MPDEKRGNKTERRKMFIYRYHPKVLLERVKNRISELDHWTEKEETQPAVDVIIRNTLWSELPESYSTFIKIKGFTISVKVRVIVYVCI